MEQAGFFERKPYILAIVISILLVVWMASGQSQQEQLAKKQELTAEQEALLPKVEVTKMMPQLIHRSIDLYGRTEPNKSLKLSSEVEGQVAEILVREGQFVHKDQIVVKLKIDDQLEQLAYSQALVKQREIEYQGAQSLSDKGLQGKSILAQAKAALAAAHAEVKNRKMALNKRIIRAPFSGVLDNRQVEIGTYVRKGDLLFQLVDLNPLVVTADVTEKYINQIDQGTQVLAKLVDGSQVKGKIRYLASVSEQGTNTFPIEITIANPQQQMRAGISTELLLQFSPEQAIKVSPSILALDADGNLGVKTVINHKVAFQPIDLIKADRDGIWLGGFSGTSDVITLGQGFVRPGDKVQVSYRQ